MSATEPPGRGMRFAEGQLRRHGWRRGRGLGKREDGIAEAIRVKVKCDTAGVGHDAAEPFSFHWWDHVFNKAAANIAVEAGQDGVAMKTLSEQGAWISTKKPRKAGGTGSMLYGRFVKSATLTASGEESAKLPTGSESSEEEEEKLDLSSARRLTDEELMRACGGRTAHKGARHGLTMSAKLARLEEQERAFLATYRRKEQQREPPENSPPAEGQKTIKEKKKQSRDRANPELLQEPSGEEELAGEEGKVVKRKKKKKQEPSREEEVAGKEEKPAKRRKKKKQEPSREEEVAGKEEKPAKRRKKKKKQEEEDEELDEPEKKKKKQQQEEEDKEPEKKKRQHREEEEDKEEPKKKKEEDKEEPAETEVPLEDTDGSDHAGHRPRKKRKKRKREPE
ncbi:G patch domain-containing protein 4 [Falco peregrinus]|uniref:G patch domain-containing protein 4 n=1 Tax=Falco peregrinus TaxID=8954 RepID=UPI0024788FF7|nr:G patch domain-containing protein 4 [Falco peregrinus]